MLFPAQAHHAINGAVDATLDGALASLAKTLQHRALRPEINFQNLPLIAARLQPCLAGVDFIGQPQTYGFLAIPDITLADLLDIERRPTFGDPGLEQIMGLFQIVRNF